MTTSSLVDFDFKIDKWLSMWTKKLEGMDPCHEIVTWLK